MADTPNSYKDAYWSDLASKAEGKAGIPTGLLSSIVNYGERSNHDQVSEAGARTVFQIIPATRKAILDKYGIDPYLNPENAAEGAALLLKESLDRNQGDTSAAVAEYHGGTNRKNWGPRTNAYVGRVLNGLEEAQVQSISGDFANWLQQNPAVTESMNPAATQGEANTPTNAPANDESTVPDTSAVSQDFGNWLAQQQNKPAEAKDPGFLGGIQESITGAQRATPTTESLPDWAGMPELNELSFASAKTGLGTFLAQPDEIAQIVKANYPNAVVRQDEKGNYVIQSSVDGKEYAIKPGFQVSDIPRAIGGLAAFTPAGRATSIAGGALAAGGTQAAIEASQAATGGNFSPTDVALTAAVGGIAPPLISGVRSGVNALTNQVGKVLARGAGQEAAPIADNLAQKGASAMPDAAPVMPPNPVTPMSLQETAQTATKAAEGGLGSKQATQTLAEQAAPDAKVIESAKRLGIQDYLQPDHVTTNQVYREVAQAAKSMPGSQARSAEIEGLTQVAKKADELINTLGGTDDLASVSQNVRRGLEKTQQTLEQKSDALYGQLKSGIPAKTSVEANNVLTFIKQQADDLGGSTNLSSLEKNIQKKLQGQPTYAMLDRVRKDVGAAARMSGPFADADTGLAKKLYSLISDDQAAVAKAHGLSDVFEQAKASVQLRKGIEDDLVALFGKNIGGTIVGDIGGSVRSLAAGDTSKFLNLIKSIPENMRQEVVASGLNAAFGKTAKQGALNFNSYAKWYEGLLKNKSAHAALMTNLPPKARKQLSDLYRISNSITKSSRERITTGRLNAAVKSFEGGEDLAGRMYSAAANQGRAIVGGAIGSAVHPGLGVVVASVLTRGAKTPAIEAVDKLLASPDFQQAVTRAANGQSKQAAAQLAKSKVFSNFVFKLQNPGELSNRERWILQSLEAQSGNQTQPTPKVKSR